MSAKQKQGMAALEEFLQEKYVDSYDEIDGSDSEKINKVEELMNIDKYSLFFYIPSKEGIGGLRYVVDYEGRALYLIKKSGLPSEIRDSLVGGDAGQGTYMDYLQLNDVYGVTSNLKVYYCSSGIDSIQGIAKENLDNDNPERKVYDSSKDGSMYNILKDYDKKDDSGISDGILTVEELKNVKELSLSQSDNLNSLANIYNLVNLESITLDNVTLTSLVGLENVPKLNYLCFKNYSNGGVISDYSTMSKLKNLSYLYIDSGTQAQVDSVLLSMKGTDYLKLQYIGFYGSSAQKITNITNLSNLKELTKTTKEKINYMYLYYNNLSSIEDLYDFSNIRELHIYGNTNLKSAKGIKNMSNLISFYAYNCNLGALEIDDEDRIKSEDSLYEISNKKLIGNLQLNSNPNLKHINYLSSCTKFTFLYLAGCPLLVGSEVREIRDLYMNCDPRYRSIDSKFLVYLNSEDRIDYSNMGLKDDSEEIQALINNTDCEALNLSGNTSLTNTKLQNVLKTMTKIQYLDLKGLSNLTSINFVQFMPDLIELNLHSTGVTDLSYLETYCSKIYSLVLSNPSTDLTKIENVISQMDGNTRDLNKSFLGGGTYRIGVRFKNSLDEFK